MISFSFEALGTKWAVSIDAESFPEQDQRSLTEEIAAFERRFSRFLPESESNQFRAASPGTFEVSGDFLALLSAADHIRCLTRGAYDPAVGGLLERAGYDASYRFSPDGAADEYEIPRWFLEGGQLRLDAPIVFDFGGIGKGYSIDLAARLLRSLGYEHFLINGGGDIFGTEKRDGTPFRVALEWPGTLGTAFGVVPVSSRGIAVSDRLRRRWGDWHHIVHSKTKRPIETIIGCAAIAPCAFLADQMTSALFLSDSSLFEAIACELSAEWIVFFSDGSVRVSEGWEGELF